MEISLHSIDDLQYISDSALENGCYHLYTLGGLQKDFLPELTCNEFKVIEGYAKPLIKLACFIKNLITNYIYRHNYSFVTGSLYETKISLVTCSSFYNGYAKYLDPKGDMFNEDNRMLKPKLVFIGRVSSNPLLYFATRFEELRIYPVVLNLSNDNWFSGDYSGLNLYETYCEKFYDSNYHITLSWLNWQLLMIEYNKRPNKEDTEYPQIPNFLDESYEYHNSPLGIYLRDDIIYLKLNSDSIIATLNLPVWIQIADTTSEDAGNFGLEQYATITISDDLSSLSDLLKTSNPNRTPAKAPADLTVEPGAGSELGPTPPWTTPIDGPGLETVIKNPKTDIGARCYHLAFKFNIPLNRETLDSLLA